MYDKKNLHENAHIKPPRDIMDVPLWRLSDHSIVKI